MGPTALRAGLRHKTHVHRLEQELLMFLLASISGRRSTSESFTLTAAAAPTRGLGFPWVSDG